jgi:hypothetical protein
MAEEGGPHSVTWRIDQVKFPYPLLTDNRPQLLEVTASAVWLETFARRDVLPSVEITFWLPASLRNLDEIEAAAFAYLRERWLQLGGSLLRSPAGSP